ncbi:head GIN domain-containing protein [Ulvibacter litoralis]|uniref:Putative auto-transporter adhesin, head GIN domain n=1 Tax=Ulvibacter litoralis TaxID=227084 RepID=A0A1G7DAH8_9FLAO|nr:head GIN domain-containing protein [Ulvibacter litoralis]GHC44293.1 hypothetical protein GCM10008083_03500 [Ulvibacter litoralis]SDE48519.1 Putative auto-transporter adhesin, head GIN domain [Ulvibacter litoralis]
MNIKHLTVCIFLCLSSLTWGQETTKDVGTFNELKVFDLIDVNLRKSTENKVVVTGENATAVKFINDDGTLKIRMELNERFDGALTKVEVFYTEVSILDANEGAYITASEAITQNNIELRVQEGGHIEIPVAVEDLIAKSVSGGIISTTGTAKNQDITINTGGQYLGKELQNTNATVSVTAGGLAELKTSENANVKVTAGGKVYLYGKPETLRKKKFAGGKIKVVE